MDHRQYLKHFAMLFTGTVVAQVINLASYPFLTRIYSPAEFGAFAIFVSAAAIPSALACARFDLAVPTAPHWGRFAILWLCFAVAAGTAILSALGSATFWLIKDHHVQPALPLLFGSCVGLTGFCGASTLYLMRHDLYFMSSASVVVRTGGAVSVQLLLGLLWKSPLALIIGFAAGLAAQGLMLAWTIGIRVPPRPSGLRQIAALFRRYRRQVTVDIPSTFIAALSLNLLTLLLAHLYGTRVVGYYALAQRIAIVPLQLFNDSLSQVFFQKAARAEEERGHFWPEMKLTFIASAALGLAMVGAILVAGPPLVVAYLGHRWTPVATMLIILAPMLAARAVTTAIQTAALVVRRAHWSLIHNIANVGVTFIAYGIALIRGWPVYQFLVLAAVLLAAEYLVYGIFLVAVGRKRKLAFAHG